MLCLQQLIETYCELTLYLWSLCLHQHGAVTELRQSNRRFDGHNGDYTVYIGNSGERAAGEGIMQMLSLFVSIIISVLKFGSSGKRYNFSFFIKLWAGLHQNLFYIYCQLVLNMNYIRPFLWDTLMHLLNRFCDAGSASLWTPRRTLCITYYISYDCSILKPFSTKQVPVKGWSQTWNFWYSTVQDAFKTI